jgi:TonB family protein
LLCWTLAMAIENESVANPLGLLPHLESRSISFGISLMVNLVAAAATLYVTMSAVHENVQVPQYDNVTIVFPVTVPEEPKPLPVPKPRVEPERPREAPAKIRHSKELREEPEPDLSAARLEGAAMPELPSSPARIASLLRVPSNVPPAPVISPASRETAGIPNGGVVQPSGVVAVPQPNPVATPLTVGVFQQSVFATQGTSSSARGTTHAAAFASGIGAGSSRTGDAGSYGVAHFGEGSGGTNANGAGSSRGGVKRTSFGVQSPAPVAGSGVIQPATQSSLPVITFKPQPKYTREGMRLKIQGEVVLQTRLCVSGKIEVLRVVSGLGHGLDEEAAQVIQHIRFRPALKDGQPVDEVTLIHVEFHLT